MCLKNAVRFICFILLMMLLYQQAFTQYKNEGKESQNKQSFYWPEGKRVAISLSFDDARVSQIDTGIPILDRYNIKATFYVQPSNVEKRVSGWREAVSNGHEIGNHTLTHPCTGNYPFSRDNALEDYTLEKIAQDIDQANKDIERLLTVKPVTFAYPCGQKFVGRGRNVKTFVPLVADRFFAARGWLGENSNDPLFCDMNQLLAVENDGLSFEQMKNLIDEAAENGRWLIFAGHDIADSGRQTTLVSTLEALGEYAQNPANGLWIDTIQNIARYIMNQREIEEKNQKPGYLHIDQAIEKRIDDLLARMTLEEKVGQMNMPCVYKSELGKTIEDKRNACKQFAEGTYVDDIGPGGGFFTLANNILPNGPRQQAEYFNELQKIALEKTRLKIPLLQVEEGTHGLMCSGGTIFPEGLAIGSTWNMDLVREIYTVAAREARAVGIHELFTLVVEPIRDPRLGRNQEAYSEDSYLCARIAESIVEGTQGEDISARDKVVAGLCHYPGQSEPVSGLERGTMEVSERKLRNVFLPPWVAGIKKKGALGVMATYPSIDDIPVHGSYKILTEILREELQFKGLVLGEGNGLSTLEWEKVAASPKEASVMALKAGVDVGISFEDAYMKSLIENVNEGNVSMDLIDRSVRRILRMKYLLGLFDNPYVDPDYAEKKSHTQEHQDLALRAAHEGIVLLKNENNLLPLDKNKIKSIAVFGPNADHDRNQLGDYVSKFILQDIVTVLDGIQNKVSENTKIEYVKGCNVLRTDMNEFSRARNAAQKADVAIVVVGENYRTAPGGIGTNGEGKDIASLDLTGLQEDLIKTVYETGTPTIVVLVNGRPLSIRWTSENIPAILEAWICGEKGGHAIADILFGDVNPSGRLAITIPRHVGQLPMYYNYKPTKERRVGRGGYADMSAEPLYEFGFGLSYTTFEYSNLHIAPKETSPDGDIHISLDVTNTGTRQGKETVQLYINDVISSVTTPVNELKGFEKISLLPGETKTVRFTLTPEHLSLLNRFMERVVESGIFDVKIGRSSKDIQLKGSFEIIEN